MADLTRQNPRVNQINFAFDEEGELTDVSAHVSTDIFDGETKLTTVSETTKVEVTDGERKALAALIRKITK